MADLFDIYPAQQQSPSVDLLDKYNPENMPGTEEEALELAKKRISAQYPGMPDWLRDAILKITPREPSPMLDSAARGVSAVTDYIPSVAGGLLQGASIPIRGVAGLIPTEFTQRLADSPDLTTLFAKPQSEGQEYAQLASELVGGGGLFGKLLGGTRALAGMARVPQTLRTPAALATSGAIATPGDSENRALGAAGALALGGAAKVASKSAEKIAPFIRGLFNESTPETLIESVQKPHDALERTATNLYNQVRNAIQSREIKTPINEKLIEQVREHFPKNARSYQELLQKAKDGDYEAIHKIQSSLYKKGTKALSSDDLAVENQGEDILDLRDKINEELNSHLIKEGHLDIAHVLGQGKKLYSQLQKTYYDKLLPKGLIKLVHQDTRLIPENPENLFKQNSVPMKRFLDKHPETAKHYKQLIEKQKAHKNLNKLLLGSGVTGGTITAAKFVNDLFNK